MEPVISKEEFDKLMEIEGKARGLAIKEPINFIFKKEGADGLKKLEDTITNLGYPLKLEKIKMMSFYPIGLYGVILLTVKKLFNYSDKEFQEMGKVASKLSALVRVFMKYLVSLEKIVRTIPKYWKRYFTVGAAKLVELNEEKKYMILRIENFSYLPLHCQVLKGYFSGVIQMVVGDRVTCEETKCPFRGDEYHEFLVKW
jgi:predicted hydrocarbon binding protein